jgi:hypothetical protein
MYLLGEKLCNFSRKVYYTESVSQFVSFIREEPPLVDRHYGFQLVTIRKVRPRHPLPAASTVQSASHSFRCYFTLTFNINIVRAIK